MGKGIDIAKEIFGASEHAALLDDLKDQLLIVFLKRLGGKLECPISEVDDTGGDMLSLRVADGKFYFEIERKP